MKLAALTAVLFLAGCGTAPVLKDGVSRLSLEERETCTALGGRVELILMTREGCITPTRDAGKICTDSSECQGRCDAPFRADKGASVSGTCSPSKGSLGCVNAVIQGKASGEFCFD